VGVGAVINAQRQSFYEEVVGYTIHSSILIKQDIWHLLLGLPEAVFKGEIGFLGIIGKKDIGI